jgi:hypothetical protein
MNARTKSALMLCIAAAVLASVAIWAARDADVVSREPHAGPAATVTPLPDAASGNPGRPAAPASAVGAQAPTLIDLETALEAADPGKQDLVIAQLLPALIASNPAAAGRFAELQEDHYLRETSRRLVAQRWALMDAEAALAWAASLGDPRERDETIADIALAVAQEDPRRAIALRERYAVAGARDAAVIGLAEQWAMKDFSAALAWTQQQGDPQLRTDLLQRLAFVQAENGQHHAAAQLASEMITDERARLEALAMVAAHWAYRDLPAARAWARTLEGPTRIRVEQEINLFAVR